MASSINCSGNTVLRYWVVVSSLVGDFALSSSSISMLDHVILFFLNIMDSSVIHSVRLIIVIHGRFHDFGVYAYILEDIFNKDHIAYNIIVYHILYIFFFMISRYIYYGKKSVE
jgi:hypothetical protein